MLKPRRCNTYKKQGVVQGGVIAGPGFHVPQLLRCNPDPLESIVYEM